MRKGCWVEVVYTQMSQRVKGPDGKWLRDEDGDVMGYGVADCLSTPRAKVKVVKANKGRAAKRKLVKNSVYSGGLCSGGSLRGKVPVTSTGMWLNRKGYKGGRLKVRMSCPVAAKYDPVKKKWSVVCIRNDIFTHHKMMLVDGHVRGRVQKYVMSGSANWSGPGLRDSDEIVTEIQDAPVLYDEYKRNYDYLKTVVAKNSKKSKRSKAKTYMLQASADTTIDVRGMTDEQLIGQGG
jgi:phosphatidylserine/phosphatidylglycerophosphate/cardiolipin synthase-like enzyme